MAAVLSCGPEAALSHGTGAALLGMRAERRPQIDVSIPEHLSRRGPGLMVHRRAHFTESDIGTCRGIPVTTPVRTLVDLATGLPSHELEAAVNEADKLGLVDPEALRSALDTLAGRPGVAVLRKLLDRGTFRLTDTELERRFLRLVANAGFPPPRTREYVNGFKVDFYWPGLGLVVETDGLRYHRSPAQQARDRSAIKLILPPA